MRHTSAAVFLIIVLVIPTAATALTLDEMQSQLLSMLERISVLKQELEQQQKATISSPSEVPCLSLSRTLRMGMKGQDVQKLQEFLIAFGVLSKNNATGYFGPLTQAAVQKWQSDSGVVASGSPGSTGFGVVGPKSRKALLSACKNRDRASSAQRARCPVEPNLPITPCAGAWEKGRDASECVTGYTCSADQIAPLQSAAATSSITVIEPRVSTIATGGNTLTISWRSENVGAGSVSISLIDFDGAIVGEIAQGLATSGRYLWRVPAGSTNCSQGENAFNCIEKFTFCDGSSSICALLPGLYRIRLVLGTLSSESEPFRIAGTSITDILQSILGAPIVLPLSPTTTNAGSPGANSCVHDGTPFTEGTTLSVPCSGNCPPGVGTGYIAGTCTGGKWCIPFTTYCAASFAAIDLNAYAGGGGATQEAAVQSVYTAGCPQEGWRAYLTCSYGGCTTGWNVCRGGVWVLDSVQETVTVGEQGSCESGQVWCGIGVGFGCVAANLCVNGNAL